MKVKIRRIKEMNGKKPFVTKQQVEEIVLTEIVYR